VRGSKREVRGQKGVWELRVYGGTEDGQEIRKSRVFRGGARQADVALRDLIKEVEKGKHSARRRQVLTLSDLIAEHLEAIEVEGRSPTTLREYRRLTRTLIEPELGTYDVRKLTPSDLRAFYARLTRGSGGRKPLSASSVRQVHAVIRGSLNMALDDDRIDSNPALRAKPPAIDREPKVPPTPAEVLTLIEAALAEDEDMGALIALTATTGARRGEVLGLQWGDVDWAAPSIRIERSAYVIERGKTETKRPKTKAARRTVQLGANGPVIKVLRSHYEAMTARAEELGIPLKPKTPIFSYDLRRPISPDAVTHYVRQLGRRLGIDVHTHLLRHYAATDLLVTRRVDATTVSSRLGHASPMITQSLYAHALPASDQEAAAEIEAGIFG
jgi:integrase